MMIIPPNTAPEVNRSSKMSFDIIAVVGGWSVMNTAAVVADDRRIAQVWREAKKANQWEGFPQIAELIQIDWTQIIELIQVNWFM